MGKAVAGEQIHPDHGGERQVRERVPDADLLSGQASVASPVPRQEPGAGLVHYGPVSDGPASLRQNGCRYGPGGQGLGHSPLHGVQPRRFLGDLHVSRRPDVGESQDGNEREDGKSDGETQLPHGFFTRAPQIRDRSERRGGGRPPPRSVQDARTRARLRRVPDGRRVGAFLRDHRYLIRHGDPEASLFVRRPARRRDLEHPRVVHR